MKTKTKYGALCNECGNTLYPELTDETKSNRMNGITVSMGTCPRCKKKDVVLIPTRDYEYARGNPGYDWD